MTELKTGGVQKQLSQTGSPVKKYKHAVIGDKGWLALICYELIVCCFAPIPGKLGGLLRRLFFPFLFNCFGKGIKIDKDLTILQPSKICLGDGVIIENNVSIGVKGRGKRIVISRNVRIGRQTVFSCIGSEITIGEETVIGEKCRLGSLQGLTVGRSCKIADQTYIVGASHGFNRLDTPIIEQPITCKGPSIIGDYVEIGNRVTILDGVKIGSHVRIADDSLVNKDVDEGKSVAGVPATIQ